jgi:poly-gamma-glutamate synthesis protein (capsule biosynthesis protein)
MRALALWAALCAVAVAGCRRAPPEAAVPAPPPQPRPPQATVIAVGDIMLEGYDLKGPDPFRAVTKPLRAADIAFGNLECPLATGGSRASKRFTFRAAPETAQLLADAGFDLLCLANNHSVDYGRDALKQTIATLESHGIGWVGAGTDAAVARSSWRVIVGADDQRRRTMTIAFLAYSHTRPTNFYADARRAGTNPAIADNIRQDVTAAANASDAVVVSFHWGIEHARHPRPGERELARLAVDSGADLVLGHHPHVLQGVERYRGAVIAYSLGNFVFKSKGAAAETALLRCRLRPQAEPEADIIPALIKSGRPQPATGADAQRILRDLARMSERLGTELSIAGDRARVASSPS